VATILVVEDEKPLRDFLVFFLEGAGHRVLQAISGQHALLLVAEERPDLVLSDIMMPLLSGVELCRQLKAAQDTRAIPVILMSAVGWGGEPAFEDTGANAYLDKPFSLDALEALVRRWTQ